MDRAEHPTHSNLSKYIRADVATSLQHLHKYMIDAMKPMASLLRRSTYGIVAAAVAAVAAVAAAAATALLLSSSSSSSSC